MSPKKQQLMEEIFVGGCGQLKITIQKEPKVISATVRLIGNRRTWKDHCAGAHMEMISALISLCIENDIPPREVAKSLVEIKCEFLTEKQSSCACKIAKYFEEHEKEIEEFLGNR